MTQISSHFWRTCIETVLQKHSKTFEPTDDEMHGICDLYEAAGGRWEALAKGDPASWGMLRKACVVYLKHHAKKESDDEE